MKNQRTLSMKMTFRLPMIVLFILLSIPSQATAKFTGIMEMSLTMPNGSALVTYLFGKTAQRMDMVMRLEKIPEPLKTTVITKSSRPDEAVIISHATKTWSAVNLRSAAENATLLDFDSSYTLKKIGRETVKGYQCDHVRLTSTTEQLELWISNDLADFSTFRLLQSQNPRLSNTSLAQTLSRAGIEGFPVRIVQKNESGMYVMELAGVTPKTLPESSFSVPSGYARAESDGKAVNERQKEHLRNLIKKMKDFDK